VSCSLVKFQSVSLLSSSPWNSIPEMEASTRLRRWNLLEGPEKESREPRVISVAHSRASATRARPPQHAVMRPRSVGSANAGRIMYPDQDAIQDARPHGQWWWRAPAVKWRIASAQPQPAHRGTPASRASAQTLGRRGHGAVSGTAVQHGTRRARASCRFGRPGYCAALPRGTAPHGPGVYVSSAAFWVSERLLAQSRGVREPLRRLPSRTWACFPQSA